MKNIEVKDGHVSLFLQVEIYEEKYLIEINVRSDSDSTAFITGRGLSCHGETLADFKKHRSGEEVQEIEKVINEYIKYLGKIFNASPVADYEKNQ